MIATNRLLAAACILAITATTAPAQVTTIPDRPTCTTCTITVSRTVRLGDESGPGALPGMVPTDMIVDSAKRFWLFYFAHVPMVFDSLGRHVANVGRKGQGPGEFNYPFRGMAFGDSVLVFDHGNRAVVVGPDLKPVRTIRMNNISVGSAEVMNWPAAVLVSATARVPGSAGHPLHVVDMTTNEARIVRSFGGDGTVVPARTGGAPALVVTGSGTLWSIDAHRYELSSWDQGGQRGTVLRRMNTGGLFATEASGGPGNPERAPDATVHNRALVDSNGLLWTVVRVPASTWKEAWVQARLTRPPDPADGPRTARGNPSIRPMPPVPAGPELFSGVIELIDPRQRVVVASRRLEEFIVNILSGGRIALYEEDADGTPYLAIARLDFRGR